MKYDTLIVILNDNDTDTIDCKINFGLIETVKEVATHSCVTMAFS